MRQVSAAIVNRFVPFATNRLRDNLNVNSQPCYVKTTASAIGFRQLTWINERGASVDL